ncbi:hypothetical protein ES703_25997 [subsurface metagenome]
MTEMLKTCRKPSEVNKKAFPLPFKSPERGLKIDSRGCQKHFQRAVPLFVLFPGELTFLVRMREHLTAHLPYARLLVWI